MRFQFLFTKDTFCFKHSSLYVSSLVHFVDRNWNLNCKTITDVRQILIESFFMLFSSNWEVLKPETLLYLFNPFWFVLSKGLDQYSRFKVKGCKFQMVSSWLFSHLMSTFDSKFTCFSEERDIITIRWPSIPDFGVSTTILNTVDVFRRWFYLNLCKTWLNYIIFLKG